MTGQHDGVGAGEATVPLPAQPPPPPGPDIDAARLRGMVAGLNAIVWERDPVTWAIRYVNDRIEEVLGYPAAQWRADPELWFRVLHPDDREGATAALERALAGEQDFTITYRVRAADDRVVWLRHLGHITRDPAVYDQYRYVIPVVELLGGETLVSKISEYRLRQALARLG